MTASLRMLAFALCSLAVVSLACGGSDTPAAAASGGGGGAGGGGKPCNEAPFTCPTGQTCWVTDQAGSSFACFNSAKGLGKGAKCDNIVGKPSCDDGLMCFSTDQKTGFGSCIPFCDTDHPCDTSEKCSGIAFSAALKPFVFACVGAAGAAGAGGGGGAGGMVGGAGGT